MPIDAGRLLEFSDNEFVVEGKRLRAEYPIRQAVVTGDLVAVLYEYMDVPPGIGNLVAYDRTGLKKWVAETPDSSNAGCYVEMIDVSESKIDAYVFSSYRCIIDALSGRLLSAEFTK